MTKEEIIEECKQRLGFETDYEMYSLCQHEKDFYNAIIKALEQRPSGEWIESMYRTNVCSNCGENPTKGTGVTLTLTHLNYEYKYCRFCGAKMRGK